ncbi:SH3 domain-containing protein [Yoonia maritima]|uniref:SH3 domain-containing protein n=1 Tax=Yoonia maritima TaxID=1435347 RepID=UPI0013A623A6|nr:SH3 domain-containing protein [Yoonia maritima]
MYKFIISTTLLFAWAFFEISGGFDFEPGCNGCDVTANDVISEHPSTSSRQHIAAFPVNNYDYVPFHEPIIEAEKPVVTAQVMPSSAMVVQASFSTDDTTGPQPQKPRQDLRVVTGDWVNIRDGAGTGFAVMDTVPHGTETELLDMQGDWVKVRLLESNEIGWIASWLISD